MQKLRGIVPPVVTPMSPDGTIDLDSLDRVVDHLIDAGCTGLFVLGSSGQVAYLTDSERDAVVERTVQRAAGRVPVLVGTPDLSARRMAECGQRVAALGADAIVVTSPLYALNDMAEIEDHFRIVAANVDVPVYAYNVPVRVHSYLAVDMLVRLGQEGVLRGVKDSSGDDVGFRRLVQANKAAGSPLELLTGHEVMVDGMALLGADGAVPGLGNVDPAGYVRLWNAAEKGDWAEARKEQDRLTRLFDIVFVPKGMSGDAGGIGAFKQAMASLGVISSAAVPAPLRPLDASCIPAIEEILREVDLLA
ncbi:dihydrodipicolinate synthase family protein [Tessaracoccus sp. ZS01]|uniref:dihydrodipicolinate synthase family protein n=1 Tax=Tessaracoccus sp. ZS01 TaxID=1906324 RepID=UPI00096EAC5A|nr:dihydrodipicolinate synthase family protein [Tessaracoccus sp. ZS01]MCG6567434.1 dihydrodipicolinate synthase family protein [Tessaracoccus sp. ZS01]OMG57001.1 dihydrodipicolinate synthase family protein [Tessaracoccus sp. ZS01]